MVETQLGADFLDNCYSTAAPYQNPDLGRNTWRLVPDPVANPGSDRFEHLACAVDEGHALLHIEASDARQDGRWERIVSIQPTETVDLDDQTLKSKPHRMGRGISPGASSWGCAEPSTR